MTLPPTETALKAARHLFMRDTSQVAMYDLAREIDASTGLPRLIAEHERVRIEIVGSLTSAGIYMLVDADPTANGEIESAVRRLAGQRDKAIAERDRLGAIVAKLPHTADGVPIVPGMELWGVYSGHENDNHKEGSGTIQRWTYEPALSSWAIYSTRAAALAASKPSPEPTPARTGAPRQQMEIVDPSGNVSYRRPEDDPMIAEALKTPGYTVRPYL